MAQRKKGTSGVGQIHHQTGFWQRDYLVVIAEAEESGGVSCPVSVSFVVVERCLIKEKMHITISWPSGSDPAPPRKYTGGGAALDPHRVMEGPQAVQLAHNMLSTARKEDVLVVTHAVQPGMEALLAAFPPCLGKLAPSVAVVSTAVLERARQAGVLQGRDERDIDFYGRAAALEGPLPDLPACLDMRGISLAPLLPTDRLFSAFATHRLFFEHLVRRAGGSRR